MPAIPEAQWGAGARSESPPQSPCPNVISRGSFKPTRFWPRHVPWDLVRFVLSGSLRDFPRRPGPCVRRRRRRIEDGEAEWSLQPPRSHRTAGVPNIPPRAPPIGERHAISDFVPNGGLRDTVGQSSAIPMSKVTVAQRSRCTRRGRCVRVFQRALVAG